LAFLLEQFDSACFKLNMRHVINKSHEITFST
jgi:hypothetical protein